jgi:hypothetical protein
MGRCTTEIKIFSEEYKSLRPIIIDFLHPPVNISLLRPYVFLFVPFSTFSLHPLIDVEERVHTHMKQRDKLNCVGNIDNQLDAAITVY